jgi:hypothetical protein
MRKQPSETVSNIRVILFIIFALAMLIMCRFNCGCVHTVATMPDGTQFKRTAFLYPFKLEAIECDPQTGLVTILGYDTDGGEEVAKAVAEGVTRALLKAGIAP